jgi:hypothetical protein
MTWPVTHRISSVQSQAINLATSSGLAPPERHALGDFTQHVSVGSTGVGCPGLTVLTVIPRATSDELRSRVVWWIVPLETTYHLCLPVSFRERVQQRPPPP